VTLVIIDTLIVFLITLLTYKSCVIHRCCSDDWRLDDSRVAERPKEPEQTRRFVQTRQTFIAWWLAASQGGNTELQSIVNVSEIQEESM